MNHKNKYKIVSEWLEFLYNEYGDFYVKSYIPQSHKWSDVWKKREIPIKREDTNNLLYYERRMSELIKNESILLPSYRNSLCPPILRTILHNEVIMDLDTNIDTEKKKALKFLDENKIKYQVWHTGGSGYHIRILFVGLEKYNYEQRSAIRKEFIKNICDCDLSKVYDSGVIGIENIPHRKSGIKKTLKYSNCETEPLNNFLPLTESEIQKCIVITKQNIQSKISVSNRFINMDLRCDLIIPHMPDDWKTKPYSYFTIPFISFLEDFIEYSETIHISEQEDTYAYHILVLFKYLDYNTQRKINNSNSSKIVSFWSDTTPNQRIELLSNILMKTDDRRTIQNLIEKYNNINKCYTFDSETSLLNNKFYGL